MQFHLERMAPGVLVSVLLAGACFTHPESLEERPHDRPSVDAQQQEQVQQQEQEQQQEAASSRGVASSGLRAAWVRSRQREGGTSYTLRSLDSEDMVAEGTCASQQMAWRFSAQSVEATLDVSADTDTEDTLRFELSGVGRGSTLEAPDESARPIVQGAEIRYARGSLTEWYLNGPLGLEQGFVVHDRSAGSEPLGLAVRFEGLTPELRGDRVALVNDAGLQRAWYGALHVTDANADVVPSWFEVTDQTVVLRIDDAAAHYPLDVDPLVWAEQKMILSSDIAGDDCFGCALAVDGDRAIIGAAGNEAAYIFERDSGGTDNWGQVKKITAPSTGAFGTSVGLSGDLAIVGAPVRSPGGAAYIFHRNEGGANNWGLMTNGTKLGAAADDFFGYAVAVSGSFALVGARWVDGTAGSKEGAAYFYERSDHNTDDWGIKEIRKAPTPAVNEEFGFSVAISGDYAIIGSWDQGNRGAARVYFKNTPYAEGWGLQRDLSPTSPLLTNASSFGWSVDIDGNVAIVGARGTNDAYVFNRTSSNWNQVASFTGSGNFGQSVAIRGDNLAIVGASSGAGSVSVFESSNGITWTPHPRTPMLTASNAGAGDAFGNTVAVSGDTILVGARFEDTGGSNAGAAYVFHDKLEDGDGCSTGDQCVSGECFDGVCCDTTCGGDCESCNEVGTVGTCTPLTTECRASAGPCDPAEVCDGASSDCPADAKSPSTEVCHPSTGLCDPEETCDGTNDACPADLLEPAGTTCRAAAGTCDLEETCDGASATCPADTLAETVCRPAATSCDTAESCSGISPECPTDLLAPDGATCDDGAGMCQSGSCVDDVVDEEPPVVIDNGCGCRIVGERGPQRGAPWVLLGIGLVLLRRRRS